MSALQEKSRRRVSSNQQFIDMEKQAARLAEKQKNTLKSLNIEDVRKEIEESRKLKEKDPERPRTRLHQTTDPNP